MAKEEAQAWKTSEAVKTGKISNQVTSDVFSSEKYTDVPLPQSLTTLKMLYDALPAPLPPSWISRKVRHFNCASSVAMPQHHTKTLGSHMKCVCMMTSHGLSRKTLYQIPNTPIYNIPSILTPTKLHNHWMKLPWISILLIIMLPWSQHTRVCLCLQRENKCSPSCFPLILNGYYQTIHTMQRSLLVGQGKCSACKTYHPQMRAMWSQWSKKASVSAKNTNNHYLNTRQT